LFGLTTVGLEQRCDHGRYDLGPIASSRFAGVFPLPTPGPRLGSPRFSRLLRAGLELERKLREALLRSRRFERQGALIFVDLDGVKRVNDSFGHSAGDELIRIAAVRIAGATRNVDTPARLGGDEFVILLSEFTEPKGAEIYARRLLAALSEAIEVSGQLLKPSASIGVAMFPAVGLNADDVLQAADDAMYQGKRAGGGRVFLRDGPDLREVV